MTHVSLYHGARDRLLAGWRNRAVTFKAISFAMIGVVNSAIDYGVFLLARALLDSSAGAMALFASIGGLCACGSAASISLIAANAVAWIVAASGSYIMNSTITFAAESGRKLRWRVYFAFVASGVAGWIANTATLLIAAEVSCRRQGQDRGGISVRPNTIRAVSPCFKDTAKMPTSPTSNRRSVSLCFAGSRAMVGGSSGVQGQKSFLPPDAK